MCFLFVYNINSICLQKCCLLFYYRLQAAASISEPTRLTAGSSLTGSPLSFSDPLLHWYHLHIQSLQRLQNDVRSIELQNYLNQGIIYIFLKDIFFRFLNNLFQFQCED